MNKGEIQLLWPAILMFARSARRLRGAVGGCRSLEGEESGGEVAVLGIALVFGWILCRGLAVHVESRVFLSSHLFHYYLIQIKI